MHESLLCIYCYLDVFLCNVICSVGLFSDVELSSSLVTLWLKTDYTFQYKNVIYHSIYLHEMHNMNYDKNQ